MVKPRALRTAVRHVQEAHGLSERRACRLIGIGRSSQRYRVRRSSDEASKSGWWSSPRSGVASATAGCIVCCAGRAWR